MENGVSVGVKHWFLGIAEGGGCVRRESHVRLPNRAQGRERPSPAHTSVNDDNFPRPKFMIFSSSFRILEKDRRFRIWMGSFGVSYLPSLQRFRRCRRRPCHTRQARASIWGEGGKFHWSRMNLRPRIKITKTLKKERKNLLFNTHAAHITKEDQSIYNESF